MDQGIELQRAGKPESIDLYEYQHRAQAVVDLIQECPRPFVIAVYGEWRRGKSTFLNMIVEQLRIQRSADSQEQEQVQPSILNPDDSTIAAYNPWHYRIDRFEDAWESLSEVFAESLSGDALIGQQVDTLRELLIKNKWMKLVLRVGWSAADLFPSGKASKEVIENLLRAPRSLGEAMAHTLRCLATLC